MLTAAIVTTSYAAKSGSAVRIDGSSIWAWANEQAIERVAMMRRQRRHAERLLLRDGSGGRVHAQRSSPGARERNQSRHRLAGARDDAPDWTCALLCRPYLVALTGGRVHADPTAPHGRLGVAPVFASCCARSQLT